MEPAKTRSNVPRFSGLRVVDVADDALGAAAEGLLGEVESLATRLGRELGGASARRVVERREVVDVRAGDLRAAALDLEGPEAVPGTDVQHSHPSIRSGSLYLSTYGRRSNMPGSHVAGGQLEAVVPLEFAGALEKLGHEGDSMHIRCGASSPRAVAAVWLALIPPRATL